MQPCRLAIGYSLTDEESMYMKGENTCLASDMDLEAMQVYARHPLIKTLMLSSSTLAQCTGCMLFSLQFFS